jgi:hypothetical protein
MYLILGVQRDEIQISHFTIHYFLFINNFRALSNIIEPYLIALLHLKSIASSFLHYFRNFKIIKNFLIVYQSRPTQYYQNIFTSDHLITLSIFIEPPPFSSSPTCFYQINFLYSRCELFRLNDNLKTAGSCSLHQFEN